MHYLHRFLHPGPSEIVKFKLAEKFDHRPLPTSVGGSNVMQEATGLQDSKTMWVRRERFESPTKTACKVVMQLNTWYFLRLRMPDRLSCLHICEVQLGEHDVVFLGSNEAR